MSESQMVHPARFERATSAFGGQHSIQLSYGCLPPLEVIWRSAATGKTMVPFAVTEPSTLPDQPLNGQLLQADATPQRQLKACRCRRRC